MLNSDGLINISDQKDFESKVFLRAFKKGLTEQFIFEVATWSRDKNWQKLALRKGKYRLSQTLAEIENISSRRAHVHTTVILFV